MRRRIPALLLAVLLLAASLTALAENMQKGSMYVFTPNGKTLHFRATRSTTEDNIIMEIPYGSKVYVVSWDGTWARIQYGGETGYVVKRYLKLGPAADYEEVRAEKDQQQLEKEARQALQARQKTLDRSSVKTVPSYDVTVQLGFEGAEAVLYAKPNLLSDVLGVYPEGSRLVVRGVNRDWARVYDGAGDLTGYMLLEELSVDEVEEEELTD